MDEVGEAVRVHADAKRGVAFLEMRRCGEQHVEALRRLAVPAEHDFAEPLVVPLPEAFDRLLQRRLALEPELTRPEHARPVVAQAERAVARAPVREVHVNGVLDLISNRHFKSLAYDFLLTSLFLLSLLGVLEFRRLGGFL